MMAQFNFGIDIDNIPSILSYQFQSFLSCRKTVLKVSSSLVWLEPVLGLAGSSWLVNVG